MTFKKTRWALLAFALAGHALVQAQTAAPATVAPPPAPLATASQANPKPAVVGKPGATTAIKTAAPIAAASADTKPLWKELTAVQQAALKPLAANWTTIDEAQKRKWIALSNNYATLPPAEQQIMHSRMAEWASLSQQQRSQARLNFAESNKLAPKEKAEKSASKAANWEAYQALSPAEKQKLADKAAPKPAGAAMAIKPATPEKLATVPSTRLSPKPNEQGNKLPAIDGNALQPKAAGLPDVPVAPGPVNPKN